MIFKVFSILLQLIFQVITLKLGFWSFVSWWVLFFFFLKFNDRNVKMINLWENCFFFSMHFTNTVGMSWFWLPSVNRNWIFLSQLKWFWASNPLLPASTTTVPPATRNHDPALTNRFRALVNSNWSGDRHCCCCCC